MKFCSSCRLCYDDLIDFCEIQDHLALTQARKGDRLQVEGYRIDSRIESGFPVEIYKATHLASEKNVLIRFIPQDDSCPDLKKDLKAIAEINYPNLARVFEYGEIGEDEYFVVLEEIGGQSLGEFMQKISPLLERDAIQITRQIAEGLEELHSAGVIHKAVNPHNIYFKSSDNYNFEVRLQNYDFGGIIQKRVSAGAKGVDAKTDVFRYYSPEQFTDAKIDFSSDIYSLSVVFYEMLLGRSPYRSLSPKAISNYVFEESIVEELHHDLRALLGYTLRESLQHKADMRPQTTNNFVRQLRHLELVATPAELSLIEEPHLPTQKKQTENVSPIDLKIDDFDSEPRVKAFAANGNFNEPFELDLPDIAPIAEKIKQLKPADTKFEIIEYNKTQISKVEENNLGLIDDLSFSDDDSFFAEHNYLDTNGNTLSTKLVRELNPKKNGGIYKHLYLPSIIRSSFYIAGLIILIFFSGFVTARIFEERGVVSSSPSSVSKATEDPKNDGQVRENPLTDLEEVQIRTEKVSNDEQVKKSNINNLRKTEQSAAKKSLKKAKQKLISSKVQKKNSITELNKKKSVRSEVKKLNKSENQNVKVKTKTRPRFVPDETIVIDPSKLKNKN